MILALRGSWKHSGLAQMRLRAEDHARGEGDANKVMSIVEPRPGASQTTLAEEAATELSATYAWASSNRAIGGLYLLWVFYTTLGYLSKNAKVI